MRVRQLAICSVLMPLLAVQPAAAQSYFVNGKHVDSATYQAYKLINSSIVLMQRNETSAAVNALQRALQLQPTLADAHSMLGVALARVGRTDEAAEQFRMAIADNGDLIAPRLNLAGVYQSSGRLRDALDMYDSFLQTFPRARQSAAVRERAELLRKEIASENDARNHDDNVYDTTNYLGNVANGGSKRWCDAQMPLAVFISAGDGLTGYKPQYDKLLRASFDEWQQRSDGKVRFRFVDSPADADITCRWIDDPKPLQSSAEGGESQIHTLCGSIVKVNMLLSLNDDGSPFPLTDNLIRTLCLHEIGHAIGLLGHSGHPGDIMYCTSPIVDVQQHVSARDVNTLKLIYQRDVDPLSSYLASLDKQTHGQAVQLLRLVLIILSAVMCTLTILVALATRGKRKRKRSPQKTKKTEDLGPR